MGLQATAEAAPTRHHSRHALRADRPPGSPPGSHASAVLAPEPAAARRARQLTRDALTQWGLTDLCDDAEAVASELAANAQHAATTPSRTLPAILFTIHRRPGVVTITLWDNGPGQPRPAQPGAHAETGRGLAMIAALSQRWGWWPTPRSGGKVVWSSLAAPGGTDHPVTGRPDQPAPEATE